MPAFLRKNWGITVNLLAISGKGECHIEGGLGRCKPFDGRYARTGDGEITKLVARPITNIDRRPLCINTMRTGLSWVNIRFLD